MSRPAAKPFDTLLRSVTAAHAAWVKVVQALAPASAGAFSKTRAIAIALTSSRTCCHSRCSRALTHTWAVVLTYAHEDAVAAAHYLYALSLARRARSNEHMRCPLGGGRIRSHTGERADTCVAALAVERFVAHAITTGSARSWDRAVWQDLTFLCARRCEIVARAASYVHALTATCGQTRAHTPSHAMSLNRADSCVVAFKSNALSLTRPACATRALARAVSRASGTHASSFSKSNARWLTRTATRSARGLNRPLLLVCRRKGCYTHGGHARADARDARPGARYLAVVRRRFQGRTHCHSHGRPPAAHAAGIAHSCVCGDVAFSLAQTHSRALSAARMHMRAHYISSHALCLERASTCVDAPESDARWPSRA